MKIMPTEHWVILSVQSLNKFTSNQVSLEEKSFITPKMLKNTLCVMLQHYNRGFVTGKPGEVTYT